MSADRLSELVNWFNGMPVGQALGARCEQLRPGESQAVMTANESLANPNGAVPGMILAAFADFVGGMAVATVGEPDEYFATLQLGLQFMRPGFGARFYGMSNVLRRGAGHTFVRIDIRDADQRLCVAANGIWAMLPASDAAPQANRRPS